MIRFGPKIVSDGLVLLLDASNIRSYRGTGTVWTDVSGNGNNGTLVSSPTFSSTSGGAFLFNGTSYIQGSTTLAANITGQITITAVLKVSDLSQRCVIFSKYRSTPDPLGYVFEIGSFGGLWINSLRFFAQGTIPDACDYRGTEGLSNDTNYMVTVAFDAENQTVAMYFNDVEMGADQFGSMSMDFDWAQGTNKFSIGSMLPHVAVGSGGITIYNTYVYNRILTPAEMTQNYNVLKTRYSLP